MFAELFIMFIFLIPLYPLLLWTYHEPEESILFGWQRVYKSRPEISEAAIRYMKFSALITMIYIPFFVLLIYFKHILLVLLFVAYGLIIIIGRIKIYSNFS